jgi:hypothetical protein
MNKVIVSQKTKKSKKHKNIGTLVHTERGKVIGKVVGDAFKKDKAILLSKFNALASDICTLHEAEDAGAVRVEFTTEDGVTYCAPISKFWSHGFYIDFNYGEQQALNLCHFHKQDPNQSPTTPPSSPTVHTEPPKQLRMFGSNGGHYG